MKIYLLYNNKMDLIKNYLKESISLKSAILADEELLKKIAFIAEKLVSSLKNGGKILFAGNGGSAADSQHLAAEFISKFAKERSPLPAIALTVNTSVLTAVSNDFSFEEVFSRQIEALFWENDVFCAFSTSGKSPNILKALEVAKRKGLFTVLFTGFSVFEEKIADVIINVPSKNTPIIQEAHITLGHVLCKLVEDSYFN